jgi:NDP-sugar pyrophosphorylase family protein
LDPKFKFGTGTQAKGNVHMTRSMTGRDCRIADGVHLEDCVLGDGVTIDVGVHLKNTVVGDGEFVRDSVSDARIWTKAIPNGYPAKQVGNAMPSA